jgi:protein tyrosine phosphatase (PTP) superfamily phosphohydrolase (DUF442 family)
MLSRDIESISNFLQISDRVATSGQPTIEQFGLIKAAGYQLVVNLAPLTSNNALTNEQQIVESHGMQYIHIPVLWDNPAIEDVKRFFNVMETNAGEKIWVHCAANKRVSAFIYLYHRLHEKLSEVEAKLTLEKIWIPNVVWHNFIEQVLQSLTATTENLLN